MDERQEWRTRLGCYSLPELRAILRDTLERADPSDDAFVRDVCRAIALAEREEGD